MSEPFETAHGREFAAHIERLRRGLARAGAVAHAAPGVHQRAAAVLVPVFEREGDLNLLFIRRSDSVESHRGQVAFPGGRYEESDGDLLAAALREAHEEVGIDPRTVEVLGGFPTMSTLTSGIAVAPFVGLIPSASELRAEPREVAEIFDVPLAALRDPKYRGDYQWRRDSGVTSTYPAILYGRQVIWGLTLRITLSLLELLG